MTKAPWQKWIILIFVTIGCLFTILAVYPGFMSPDSLDQYTQAKSNTYFDWHPPIMAWIWNKLLWTCDGPQPILILNNFLYWTGVCLIALHVRHFGLSLLFCLMGFAPPIINFISVIWKDTFLFSVLFFQCSLLFSIQCYKWNRLGIIIILSFIIPLDFIAIMLRHNAVPAVLPLMILTLLVTLKKIKVKYNIVMGTVSCIILFFGGLQINKLLCNNISLHPEQQLMVYDLMGASFYKEQNLMPKYLKEKINLDTLKSIYSTCDGGMVAIFDMKCKTYKTEYLSELKSSWEQVILDDPFFIIKHKWACFKCLLKSPGLLTYPYIHPNNYGFVLNEDNHLRAVYIKFISSKLSEKSYKSYYYLITCVAIFIYSILSYRKNKKEALFFPILISLSGLLYFLSYLILSPCNDFRYIYWTIGASLLSSIMLLNHITLKNNTTLK